MSDDSIRVYFYNGEWHDYDYLHEHHGITLTPATPTNVYDSSLQSYPAWIENDTGNHEYWVVRDNRWYTLNDIPYWIKLPNKYGVYLIGQLLNLDAYKMQSSEMYDYNGGLVNFDYMHRYFGITHTPSVVYYVKNEVIKCWYNEDINQYWDVDTTQWYDEPPEYGGGDTGDINSIGSTGLFLYHAVNGLPTSYGTLVDGHRLQPMCLSVPISGEFSCQRHDIELTGTWKILTETSATSNDKPCIVFATKLYEVAPNEDSQSTDNSSPTSPAGTETISYDL